MDIQSDAFPFSKDVFSDKPGFSFYEFNNGFGMISDSGNYVFDNDILKIVRQEGSVSDYFVNRGKAIQQRVYDVYLDHH